ncbi:MAG: hypothetical protein JKY09_04115 [Crocinitomicaceae bacterium]|nr:hypothetical protein [Crocinitomicaceae bacterium]
MKENKKGLHLLLARWIKWDGELWAELRDIQIKLLFERLIKEMSFTEMAKAHGISPIKMRMMFQAILIKLKKSHGKALADFLQELDDTIELRGNSRPIGHGGFEFDRIWLN